MGRYNNAKWNREYKGNSKMSVITINISDELLDILTLGKAKGWWASRSEGVRVGLGRGLPLLFNEKIAMTRKVLDDLSRDGEKLDPGKNYIRIPGRGHVEIIGEA